MIPVRQSTAFETSIGPVLDADGVAVTDGVVGDLKLKKTTGNFAALNGSATLTHVSAGVYDLVLTTSDTDTVGTCVIAMDDTVNACAPLYLQVMEEAVYDALYAASAPGYVVDQPVNVTKWLGTTVATPGTAGVPSVDAIRISTSATAADNLETAALAYSATRGLAGTALPAAAADAPGGLIISDAGGLDADAQLVTKINDILTDTGTTLQAELDGIQADTEDIQSRLPAALVNSRMDCTIDGSGMENGAVDAILNRDASGSTTNSTLGAIVNDWENGGRLDLLIDATATASALASLVTTVGVAGAGLTAADDAVIAAIGALNNPSAATIADAVWDEDATAHQTQGTFGQAIGDPGSDSDTIWALVNTNLNATISSRASQTSVDTIDDLLDSEVAAIQTSINALFTTQLTESYRAAGAAPTMAQTAFELLAQMGDRAIVGTTLTLYNLAHTAAKTFTLDSATTPTSITETT